MERRETRRGRKVNEELDEERRENRNLILSDLVSVSLLEKCSSFRISIKHQKFFFLHHLFSSISSDDKNVFHDVCSTRCDSDACMTADVDHDSKDVLPPETREASETRR